MGKRSGGSFAADLDRIRQRAAGEVDARAEAAAAQTAALADAQSEAAMLATPVDELQDRTPQAAPPTAEQAFTSTTLPTERVGAGPTPENLAAADLSMQTEVIPSQEGLAEVQAQAIPTLGEGLYAPVEGIATPEQSAALYTEQLGDESVERAVLTDELAPLFAEYAMNDSKSGEDGVKMLAAAIDAGSKSFMLSSGRSNIFGVSVDTTTMPEGEFSNDPMNFLKANVDKFTYSIKGDNKLNMSIDPSDPNSEIRPEFGRAAALAVILEIGNRMKLQSAEADKPMSERRYDAELDRINIGKAIGQRIERLLYPTLPSDSDPNAMFTGETENFGYKSRLTPEEQSLLGQVTVQGFADSPMFDWFESFESRSEDNKTKISYRLTREGDKKLAEIRRGARKALGMLTKERPVSKVPLTSGKLRGEGAYTQRKITTMVAPNQLTDEIEEAIDSLGKVAHTVVPHAALLYAGVLATTQADRSSLFAKYAKQDARYLTQKEAEILKEYEARAKIEGLTPAMLGNYDTFQQAASDAAVRIMNDHLAMRQDTLKDGIMRANEAFYYGYTAINNSSRMMITQTELNYQADKVARFLVGGAVPALMIKGSNSKTEQGFKRVIARSVIPDADKMTHKEQLAELENNLDYYVKLGNELLTYTNANAQAMTVAKQAVSETDTIPEVPPLVISTDLQALLDKHGKDGFYFAMDGLHELARYAAKNKGDKFESRAKAEADGNSNGAVIQAYQMGVEEILKKGGILYESFDNNGDIRDAVFGQIESYDPLVKDPKWSNIFKQIKEAKKVKSLLKIPIMTSIYGKDPDFHYETAKKFIDDNFEMFTEFESYDQAIEELTGYIAHGLKTGLGGALEHAKIAKRVGRAFNIADRIAEIVGANGFKVQAGGFEYIDDNPDPFIFDYGPGTDRTLAKFTTKRRVASAAASAKGVKIEPGKISDPGLGSKLRNQLAVNGTQNIDATIAQRTVTEVYKRRSNDLIMQVYDAFMGDSNSFPDLVDTANRQFRAVNDSYSMVNAERNALKKLKADVKKEVENKIASGETFDIGLEGKYKSMGDLINRVGAVINRDIPGEADATSPNYNPIKAAAFRQAKILRSTAIKSGWSFGIKSNKIKPEDYYNLFLEALNTLAIEKDLDRFIAKVANDKAAITAKVKSGILKEINDQYS